MKYVINMGFGGFCIPEDVMAMIPCDRYARDYDGDIRTNSILIDWVENHPEDSDLAVIDIPDNATD